MTRNPLLRLVPALVAAALLVSCSDDGDSTATDDSTTTAADDSTTAADGSSTTTAEGSTPDTAGGEGDEAGAASHGWSYDEEAPNGPAHWGGVCETGERQSPIDIIDAEEASDDDLPDIGFSYSPDAEATVGDSGHAIQVDHAPGSTITIRDLATGDDIDFELKQFHFHAHSEHEIGGVQQPVEVHFVHVATDGSGRRAVIGVLVEDGDENAAYAPIVDAVADLPPHVSHEDAEGTDVAGGEAETTTTVAEEAPQATVSVDVSSLLPEDLSYYRYAGSLTTPTPTCEENVEWHVMVDQIQMSSEQIAVFADRYEDGNARPTTRDGAPDLQDSRG